MHGVKRVLVFCILIVILPATLIIMPLYLRRTVFADVTYPVAESDIIEIRDGISSIFCQQHSLRMSTNFNAFQLRSKPEVSTNRKHIRLKKSMTLPDDTLEYWGFYLLKGAKVHLKFCSRYDGSRILVVKGQRTLNTCALLDHNKNKGGNYAGLAEGHEQVTVFFEDIAEIAGNVPIDELDKKMNETAAEAKRAEKDDFMSIENHGAEDLNDDDDENRDVLGLLNPVSVPSPSPATRATKQPRKKLKKGSPNSLHNRKTDEATDNTNADLITNTNNTSIQNGNEGMVSSEETNMNATHLHHPHNGTAENGTQHNKTISTATDEEFTVKHQLEYERRKREVYDQLYKKHRTKREHVYDRKYSHGGNAVNFTETDESNSVSSFETSLFDCYNGAILLAEGFPPSSDCLNAHFLENGSQRMLSKHEITEDGYYYYIFYSDNDLVRNDIHAIFDIYKPTFQYSNISDSQGCVNATNCTFPIGFLSDEIVVVEVPTRDGIEHEEDDITYLISTCHPRTEIYAIFPITVLILILSCSFL